MLELNHIYKTFNKNKNPNELFNDFNLKIGTGEFVTVIGSNGSGKSTLLNLICGNTSPDSGEIIFKGENITNVKEYKRYRRIGRVFQNPALGNCSNMTVIENLMLAENKNRPWNLKKMKDSSKEKFIEMLKPLELGLENKLSSSIDDLSGGQRQAVSLLMTTLSDIELLVLDEHTAALDPKTGEKVMQITKNIVEERKLTTIMITHNLEHAIAYGNRIIMLHEGEIILDLSVEEKEKIKMDDILNLFNQISIRRGNSV